MKKYNKEKSNRQVQITQEQYRATEKYTKLSLKMSQLAKKIKKYTKRIIKGHIHLTKATSLPLKIYDRLL